MEEEQLHNDANDAIIIIRLKKANSSSNSKTMIHKISINKYIWKQVTWIQKKLEWYALLQKIVCLEQGDDDKSGLESSNVLVVEVYDVQEIIITTAEINRSL